MKPRVLAFAAVFNEESRLEPVLAKCQAELDAGTIDEMLIVDDGSTDATPDIVRSFPRIAMRQHPQRQGTGDAIRTAYRYAIENRFDLFTLFAGNGKDDPRQIGRVLQPLLDDQADYVQGSRFLPGGDPSGVPSHRLVAMKGFTWAYSLALWRRFTDCTNGFRAYRVSVLEDPRIRWDQPWLGHSYEIEFYMHYKVVALGYRVTEVPVSKVYTHYKPGESYSKVRPVDWLTNLKPLLYLRLGLRQ